jgi:hypothetical protein
MGYAGVAGVKWVVLTNGDEYRIYNACVALPFEEKLLRAIRLTDQNSPTEDTLALIAKERIKDIDVFWQTELVNRQIAKALSQLFSPDPNPELVKLVKKHVENIPAKDVRASLARVQARFVFSVEHESPPSKEHIAAKVSLKDLIDAGLLQAPLKLTGRYKKHDLNAELLPDGTVVFQGKEHSSCTAAAIDAICSIIGKKQPINGWDFWRFKDTSGKLVSLDSAREELLKKQGK